MYCHPRTGWRIRFRLTQPWRGYWAVSNTTHRSTPLMRSKYPRYGNRYGCMTPSFMIGGAGGGPGQGARLPVHQPLGDAVPRNRRTLVDVGRVLIQAVVVPDHHVAAHFPRKERQQAIHGQVEEVVALPVDLLRHHVEGESDRRQFAHAPDERAQIGEHVLLRQRAPVVEDAVHDDIVEGRHRSGGRIEHVDAMVGHVRELSPGEFQESIREIQPAVADPVDPVLQDVLVEMRRAAAEIEQRHRRRGGPDQVQHDPIADLRIAARPPHAEGVVPVLRQPPFAEGDDGQVGLRFHRITAY